MYFLIHSLGWINDERMAAHCLESGYLEFVHCREEGCIGLSIPDHQEISRGQSLREISMLEG